MTIIYVPRAFGGTLIIQVVPPPITLVVARSRDGVVVGRSRDGQAQGKGR